MNTVKIGVSIKTKVSSHAALIVLEKNIGKQDGNHLVEYFKEGIQYIEQGINKRGQMIKEHDHYVKNLASLFFDDYDGLLIPGNSCNINPLFFKNKNDQMIQPNLSITSNRRNKLEIALVQEALKRGAPVLGICGGHQVINVALGGIIKDVDDQLTPSQKLTKNITEEFSIQTNKDHKDTELPNQVVYLSGTRLHAIIQQFKPLSFLKKENILSDEMSAHTQAIDPQNLPSLIIQSALDKKGRIKAIEVDGHPWMIGTQFHPERLGGSISNYNYALFKDFIKACASQAHKKPLLQEFKETLWTKGAPEAAHQKKYSLLKALYDQVNTDQLWVGKKCWDVAIFKKSFPHGIQSLKECLRGLEEKKHNSNSLSELFDSTTNLLNEKSKPYRGLGKRHPSVDTFYKQYKLLFNSFNSGSVRAQARLKVTQERIVNPGSL